MFRTIPRTLTRTSTRTRLAAAAVVAPLALGLTACGGDDDSDDVTTTSSQSSAQQGDAGTTTLQGDVETAAETALAEVDGTVFSVDGEPTGWDVTIVDADGVEQDLELSADATSVTRGPDADTDDDSDDAAERERLLGVSLDHLAAIEAASGEVDGTVTGVELSEDGGTATWEVTFDEDTPDEVSVDVDAETGDVLRIERD